MSNTQIIKNLIRLEQQYTGAYPDSVVTHHVGYFPEHILCYHGHNTIYSFGVIKFNHSSTRFSDYICYEFIFEALKNLKKDKITPKLAILFTDCWAECSLEEPDLVIKTELLNHRYVVHLNPDKFLHHLHH